jgi:hypothetical protein
MKSNKLPDILAELFQVEGRTLRFMIRLIHYTLNEEESPQQRKEPITVPIYQITVNVILEIIEIYQRYQL